MNNTKIVNLGLGGGVKCFKFIANFFQIDIGYQIVGGCQFFKVGIAY